MCSPALHVLTRRQYDPVVVVADFEFASRAPTLVTAPLFVVVALFVSVVVGRRVLHLLGARNEASAGERFVIAGAVGLGLLQFVPFVLGVLGILSPLSLRLCLAAITLVTLIDLPPMIAAARRAWARRRGLAAWEWFWLALLAAPLVIGFLSALAPSFDPDGLGYHLSAPKRWLDLGSIGYLPTMMYVHGPMGTEMLFTSALVVVGDSGAKLLHFAASLLAAGGVFLVGSRVGARVGAPLVGHIACVVFLYSPVGVYSVISSSYSEGTAALAIVASTLCWMLWFDGGARTWLGAAALLAGVAVSFKLTSLLFPLALGVLTVLIVRVRGRRATGMEGVGFRAGAGLVALCALPIVPWMVRALVLTGNPVFPVLARWIPSKNFSAEHASEFESYNRYMIWGNRWGYDLSMDTRRLLLGGVALAVLVIGAVVFRRQRDPVHRAVTAVLVSTIVVQLVAAGLYFRYWTPLAAVLVIPIIAFVVARLDRRTVQFGLLGLTLLLAGREVRSGLSGADDLVMASVDNARRAELREDLVPLTPLFAAANDDTAADEAVLMTYGCSGFYIDGPSMCAESLETSLRLDDWDDFNEDLARLGITHVIAPTAVGDGGPEPPDVGARAVTDLVRDDEYQMVSRLLQERGQPLATALDQTLYRIEPAPPQQ